MPRRSKPLHIVREYRPDQERCAQALLALLLWESPADAPATAQDAMCGEAPREDSSAPEEDRCRRPEDYQMEE